MADLEISTDKIGFVIQKAREIAVKVAAWDDSATSDHDAESILEDFSEDATQAELKEFIRDLNEDEQVSLVALAWIGRGSFGRCRRRRFAPRRARSGPSPARWRRC